MQEKKQRLSVKEAKLKAANFCAYQERSQKEVRNKLYTYGLYRDEVEEILSDLIVDGYINEERFAKQYAGGKFRIKKWGRNKIKIGLRQHDISPYCEKQGMNEIDENDYLSTLNKLIENRVMVEKEGNIFIKRNKIAKYVLAKGFEAEIVWIALKKIVIE